MYLRQWQKIKEKKYIFNLTVYFKMVTGQPLIIPLSPS